MGFFDSLFSFGRHKNAGAPQAEPAQESSGIRYDANLIPNLKQDHQQLFSLFTQICDETEEGNFELVKTRLRALKHTLQSHLVVENVKFYVYLQQHLADDQEASSLIADLRKEMDGIARAAVQFVNRYEASHFTPELAATFRQELAAIGEVLVKRIDTEESRLYTLYMASY